MSYNQVIIDLRIIFAILGVAAILGGMYNLLEFVYKNPKKTINDWILGILIVVWGFWSVYQVQCLQTIPR